MQIDSSQKVLSPPQAANESSAAVELGRAQEQLKKSNLWLDIALDKTVNGLAIFGADEHLIVCNKHYGEIYGLPQRLTQAGTPFASIVGYHVTQEAGRDGSDEIEPQSSWTESHVSKLARGETFSSTQHLKCGRTLHVTSQPLTDGGWVDTVEDVTERRKSAESIKWVAQHDALTEVANPMYFGEELENALRQMQLGITFALHWIDLDRFGEINNTFGRPIGDAVLRSVAERLVQSVRKDDLVARLGGDEFAIIQAGVKTQAVAEHLAKRLLRAISEPYHILGHEISISASIGVVLAPEHGTSSLELIKNVYLALYAAKAAGRGTHTMFDEERANAPKGSDVAAVRTSASRDG